MEKVDKSIQLLLRWKILTEMGVRDRQKPRQEQAQCHAHHQEHASQPPRCHRRAGARDPRVGRQAAYRSAHHHPLRRLYELGGGLDSSGGYTDMCRTPVKLILTLCVHDIGRQGAAGLLLGKRVGLDSTIAMAAVAAASSVSSSLESRSVSRDMRTCKQLQHRAHRAFTYHIS